MAGLQTYPKALRHELRVLAQRAYERELNHSLTELRSHFQRWQAGELNAFDLSDRIHKFHQGSSRELYTRYTQLDAEVLVVRALQEGLLEENELSTELLRALVPRRQVLSALFVT